MWCFCCTPEDRFVEQWEDEIENIIVNIKKARRLGKLCISKRQLGRQDPKLENEILELIKHVDRDILNTKRSAVYFLTANTDLYNERSDQIEFYKQSAQKQIYVLQLQKELLQVKQESKMLAEENAVLKNRCQILQQHFQRQLDGSNETSGGSCHHKAVLEENEDYLQKIYGKPLDQSPEFVKLQQLDKLQFEEALVKNNKLIENLRQLLNACEKEQQRLRSENIASSKQQIENFQNRKQEETFLQDYEGNVQISDRLSDESQNCSHEAEFRLEGSLWLKQEWENQNLLRIQASFGQDWSDINRRPSRRLGTVDKLRRMFSKTRHEPLLSLDDDLQQKLQSYEEEIGVLKERLQEKTTEELKSEQTQKSQCSSSKYEEIPLVQLGNISEESKV